MLEVDPKKQQEIQKEVKADAKNEVPPSPKEQKINDIKKVIEGEKTLRLGLIDGIRRFRRRIAYKQAEHAALSKLISMTPMERGKSIGYLKRYKEKLEFKISTEASSLSAEKELIRKINEINEELDKAIKSYKLRKKVDLIVGDIEEITKQIDEQEKKILESNKKLDDLYSNLRSLTGFRGERYNNVEKKASKPRKNVEISLADIAIMKDKKNGEESDMDMENMN